jgi:hypothetical protein
MPDVGVERHFMKLEMHRGLRRAPHFVSQGHGRSASWARNVPRQHRLNSLGVTTTSLLLELVTQRAGRWIWGSSMTNRRRHWLRSTEASDKHALETLRGGRTRSSQVWLGPRQKLHGENVCRMTTSISRIKTLRVYQRQPPWSCRA